MPEVPRMSEEIAIELLTRTNAIDPAGISSRILELDEIELRAVLVDAVCVTKLVLDLASQDAGRAGYGGELLRRAAADWIAMATAT